MYDDRVKLRYLTLRDLSSGAGCIANGIEQIFILALSDLLQLPKSEQFPSKEY